MSNKSKIQAALGGKWQPNAAGNGYIGTYPRAYGEALAGFLNTCNIQVETIIVDPKIATISYQGNAHTLLQVPKEYPYFKDWINNQLAKKYEVKFGGTWQFIAEAPQHFLVTCKKGNLVQIQRELERLGIPAIVPHREGQYRDLMIMDSTTLQESLNNDKPKTKVEERQPPEPLKEAPPCGKARANPARLLAPAKS